GVRLAFFQDLLEITKRDQFEEVNEVVPAMVPHLAALPQELYRECVTVLLQQAASRSYSGAPAAKRAVLMLPESMATAFFHPVDREFLFWNSRYDHVVQFIKKYKHLADTNDQTFLEDLTSMSQREFLSKHYADFF